MTSALKDMESLFDPRGGSLMAHCCEVCAEPLDHESHRPVCDECFTNAQQEGEE